MFTHFKAIHSSNKKNKNDTINKGPMSITISTPEDGQVEEIKINQQSRSSVKNQKLLIPDNEKPMEGISPDFISRVGTLSISEHFMDDYFSA